jgi:Zn-dependent M28 family amino/carboxypeptidase
MRLRPRNTFALAVICLLAGCTFLIVQPLVFPDDSRPPEVSADRLRDHVKYLSVDLYPRSADRTLHLKLAANYIHDAFAAAGAHVSMQEFTVEESKYTNVIARYGPASGPVMIIGAHFDSYGDAYAGAKHPIGYGKETHTPGADDNASGVAGLIELARLLHDHPPSRAVELVAYTLEEPPYFRTENMGSAWHVRALLADKREVQLMLCLEMIGYFNDYESSQTYPVPAMRLFYPEHGDFIALIGKFGDFGATRRAKAIMLGATDLPVRSINAPSIIQGIDFSDHLNYWKAGFPALMITDTAFYRNKNYHGPEDTYDKLDYRRMAKAVQDVYALAQRY